MTDLSNTKKQIFFLHFAGGNCFSYNFLEEYLKGYDVYQLELPGRGKRMSEQFLLNKESAIYDYFNQILEKVNGGKFLIFGHSMGASLGLEVTKRLEERNLKPEVLIVSGNCGPDAQDDKKRHLLDKKEFIAELKDMGGMPDDFFQHEDLVDFCIPILRADFKLCDEQSKNNSVIQSPIIALMGHLEEDKSKIDNWGNFTQASISTSILAGNHFFIHNHKETIANLIIRCLN